MCFFFFPPVYQQRIPTNTDNYNLISSSYLEERDLIGRERGEGRWAGPGSALKESLQFVIGLWSSRVSHWFSYFRHEEYDPLRELMWYFCNVVSWKISWRWGQPGCFLWIFFFKRVKINFWFKSSRFFAIKVNSYLIFFYIIKYYFKKLQIKNCVNSFISCNPPKKKINTTLGVLWYHSRYFLYHCYKSKYLYFVPCYVSTNQHYINLQ